MPDDDKIMLLHYIGPIPSFSSKLAFRGGGSLRAKRVWGLFHLQ